MKNPPTQQENGETEKDSSKNENGAAATEEIIEDTSPAEITNTNITNGSSVAADDDDWASEPEEGGEKLSGEMSKMVVDKDLEKPIEERLDMLHQYFMKAMEQKTIQDGKKMLNEAERLELKCKAPLLLVNVLFTKNAIVEIKQYRNLLLRFCLNDTKAQRHLLGGVEQLVYKHKDVLLAKTPHIIKALYDNDVCDEEVLLDWDKKPSGRFVKKEFVKEMIKMAKPVIDWLKEAEECSESEDENNIAVSFDDRSHKIGAVDIEKPKLINDKKDGSKGDHGNNKEADDEVDIDNI